MTGGIGFTSDGINSQRRNRRSLNDIKDKHFKGTRPKSDFSRKYQIDKKADLHLIDQIIETARKERKKELIKWIVVLFIAFFIFGFAVFSFSQM